MPLLALLLSAASLQPTDPWREVEPRLSPGYDRCFETGEAARGVHPAMMDCIAAEYAIQDARLNRTYAAALRRLRPAGQARLRNSQRGWIRTRDRRCDREWQDNGFGQLSDLARSNCRLRETVLRTIWLERYR